MHESVTYLISIVAIRLLRIALLGFIMVLPALSSVIQPVPSNKNVSMIILFCVGFGVGEVTKGMARFYRVAFYDRYAPKTERKIAALELRISKKKEGQ